MVHCQSTTQCYLKNDCCYLALVPVLPPIHLHVVKISGHNHSNNFAADVCGWAFDMLE